MASEVQIKVGGVAIGGGAPVVVQSMTLTKTYDVDATMGQIADLASAGCEIVRVAVPKSEDADALKKLVYLSPVPLIEKLHSHIFSMHLKDRKKVCHDSSENMPWGQGDTPIKDVLQCLKKNKWAIPVGIEFEYNVPAGSTWDAEIAKCVQYAKDALA